jgi:hypothetical protein
VRSFLRQQLRRVPVISEALRAVERATEERAQALAERDVAWEERDGALEEREQALAERDRARAAEEAMRAERDVAWEERDRALEERDKALLQIDVPCDPTKDAAEKLRVRVRISQEGGLKGKRALVIPVQGPIASREIEVTRPFFEAYCRRVGIDLQIIDVPPTVPPSCVKASLRTMVEEYDRFAIAEPHLIVRQGCPDLFAIVPEARIGAMIEGRWTDRCQRCDELSGLCGFRTPLPAERYVNTDLLVMSRAHLPMLDVHMRRPVSNYHLGPQDAFNAQLYHSDVPVYGLPRDFNWVPYSPSEFDWRWAWIFNMSDSWRSQPTQEYAWKPRGNEHIGYYSRTRLMPRHCRLPSLIEITEQLCGSAVRFVNPAEMSYHGLSARVHLTADDAAVMWWEKSFLGETPPIYGPYLDLRAGCWSVTLLAPDGVTPADPGIIVDVVHDFGRNTVRPPAPIGPQASFEILLDRDVTGTEVRMYSGDRDHTVGCVLLKASTDSLTPGEGWSGAGGRSRRA